MAAKHVALLALLTVVGSSALYAQPPDAPPPDQAPPDQYAPPPQDQYGPQPQDQYAQAPDQPAPPPDDQYYAPPNTDEQYTPTPANGTVDINFFYSNLSPYGHWVNRGGYGWVWLPFGIRAGWRPYTLGHWVMTDYGWTWVSDEPFGWATYHYGRWRYDDEYGWVWVPGYDWGPAWVAWRSGAGFIGWAPLPPEVRFRVGFGLDFRGVNLDVVLAPTHYCFVEERSFLEPRIAGYVATPARNVTIIHNTTNITNYTVVNNKIVNRGIAVQHVEQVTGRRVQQYQIAAVTSGTAHAPQVRGNQLTVFRPTVVQKTATPPPPPASARVTAPAAMERRHQQEVQDLQRTQAAERTRLQQVHQGERQSFQGGASAQPVPQRRDNQQPSAGAQPGEPRQPSAPRRDVQQGQAQSQGQGQPAARRPAASYQQLQQQHQSEVQAQQAQHQREQQQLQARHQAEQSQARQQPQRANDNRQGGQKNQKKEDKRPANPPPPSRR